MALGHWAPVQDLVQVKEVVEIPASQLVRDPFLLLVRLLEVVAAVQMVLQEHFLALAPWETEMPVFLVLKVQDQVPLPRLGHQSHQQDHPLLEFLLLGNLGWEAPFLDQLVLASEQVTVRLPLVAPAGHPAMPVVPVAPVGPVLLAQR